jgi:hypothetical protein
MDENEVLTVALEALATVPRAWFVSTVVGASRVLLADSREEATLPILEAVAEQHGIVVATGSVMSPDGRSIAGVLIAPNGDGVGVAAAVRLAYAMATDASGDKPSDGDAF